MERSFPQDVVHTKDPVDTPVTFVSMLKIILNLISVFTIGFGQIVLDLSIDTTDYYENQSLLTTLTMYNPGPDSVCLTFHMSGDYWIMLDGDTIIRPWGYAVVWDLPFAVGDTFHWFQYEIPCSSGIGSHYMQASLGDIPLCGNDGYLSNVVSDTIYFEIHEQLSISSNIFPLDINTVINYPNPFNNNTIIEFMLLTELDIQIMIHDISGRLIKEETMRNQAPGKIRYIWNGLDMKGRQVASNIYIFTIKAEDNIISKKIVLLK